MIIIYDTLACQLINDSELGEYYSIIYINDSVSTGNREGRYENGKSLWKLETLTAMIF